MTEHLAYADRYLPDIAGTYSAIRGYAKCPLNLRLKYLRARSEALAATGTPLFASKASDARQALDTVWQNL